MKGIACKLSSSPVELDNDDEERGLVVLVPDVVGGAVLEEELGPEVVCALSPSWASLFSVTRSRRRIRSPGVESGSNLFNLMSVSIFATEV